jgi:P22_AR N-terminal domain
MSNEDEAGNGTTEQQQSQRLEPVEQESILFHGQTIIAVRLADGRICVVLRWICDSMKLQAGGQVRKIERTASTASELVRVRVQTRGGRQTMPALTLRGFSPWILSINPGEVTDGDPAEQERIRALVVAYQEEAKDVLYEHFVSRRTARPGLPEPEGSRAAVVVPAEPMKPGPEATEAEQATYYEHLALWARWKADQYAQKWRGQVDEWRGAMEARIESSEAIAGLLPEIIERLGPQVLTTEHQTSVRGMVKRLSELSGQQYQTIYWELSQAFQAPRYAEILENQYPAVCDWFNVRIEAAKKPRRE